MDNLNDLSKKKQTRLLVITAVSLVAIITVIFLVYEYTKPRDVKSGRHYKSTLSTGVEGLSDQEMWIEKSTNDFNEIKNQNTLLQQQLDQVQKLVIGVGRYMRAFDDQQEDKTDTMSSKEIPDKFKKEMGIKPSATETEASKSTAETDVNTDMNSFNGMSDFVKSVKDGTSISEQSFSSTPSTNNSGSFKNMREQNKGISTITFSNVENEYDLDENFIFASTYARCVLVGSTTVSAGIGASSNPQPVLLRLTDMGNLPNRIKGFLKDAMVIGAAYGELSSESVVIRLERIVKIDKKQGIGIDIPVEGYVAGENGDSRIRGIVIDRAGAVVRTAAIGGFFSGVADYLTAGSRQSVTFEPNSGLAQFSPQGGSKMLQQGASKGIGNAVEKYADFFIKRAEQMQPVIMIDGGRKVTIVFTESVKASAVHMKKVRKKLYAKKQY